MKKEINENRKQLLESVKALNNSGLIENKIKVVGKGTGTKELLENFVGNVNALVEIGKSEEIPEEVIAFYNSLAAMVEDDKEPEEKKEVELSNNKKDLMKYIKQNKLNILVAQKDKVDVIQNKIKKEEEKKAEKKEIKVKEAKADVKKKTEKRESNATKKVVKKEKTGSEKIDIVDNTIKRSRSRNKSKNRMSVRIDDSNLIVEFKSLSKKKKYKLPEIGDVEGLKKMFVAAKNYAVGFEATSGQMDAVRKILTGNGYSFRAKKGK